MPGSATTPDPLETCFDASNGFAFRLRNDVGVREIIFSGLYGWPAHSRFAATLAGYSARLGADADRYSFIVSDFHRLLSAGLPAHCEKLWTPPALL